MKNYESSDYAVNKYADGIVYRGQKGTIEVTKDDFLAENPGMTEDDFIRLKKISDAIYHKQVQDENTQTARNTTIHGKEELRDLATIPLETAYMESLDERDGLRAVSLLLSSGELSTVQERRFRLYFINGLTLREIAEIEGVSHLPVYRSIRRCIDKMKKYLEKVG